MRIMEWQNNLSKREKKWEDVVKNISTKCWMHISKK